MVIFFVGCYLAPDKASTIKCVISAIGQYPHVAAILAVGNFNIYLAAPEGNRCGEDIVAAIATTGPEDISAQY